MQVEIDIINSLGTKLTQLNVQGQIGNYPVVEELKVFFGQKKKKMVTKNEILEYNFSWWSFIYGGWWILIN